MNISSIQKKFRRDNPRWVILVIDMLLVLGCYWVSNFVIDGFKGRYDIPLMMKKSPLVLSVYTLFFLYFSTYRGIIRMAGIKDATQVFKAVFCASVVLAILSMIIRPYFARGDEVGAYIRLSYSVIFMHAFFTMVVMVSARIFYRTLYELFFFPNRKQKSTLIFGGGRPGLVAMALLREDVRVKHQVVAFLEDNPQRIGKMQAALRILDYTTIDEKYITSHSIERVIIAVENNDPERLRIVSERFEELNLYIKIMPPTSSLLSSADEKREIRALKIEDLLGRKAIKLDNPEIEAEMCNKRILVTGAAGSIGSELARQIAIRNYDQLILVDQAESALYDLQHSMNASKPEDVHYIVGNVRDRGSMEALFNKYKPHLVFHAAAYKHVPLMEANPYESILTNIVGTKNIADLAAKHGAQKFVMVSTDKAVNPTNIMGATKRAAEIYVNCCVDKGKTAFIITRFGNVLGSNGSVIPLFEMQMEKGVPLTLTHPDITRFFMTIPEACQLVQEAGVMGHGGEIFVFDMGKSIKIIDLAKRMIRLKGYRYPEDIAIKITGLRPGEKIFEELLADNENTVPTHHEKIMIANRVQEDVSEKKMLLHQLAGLVQQVEGERPEAIELVRVLKDIVPEFISKNSEYEVLDKEKIV